MGWNGVGGRGVLVMRERREGMELRRGEVVSDQDWKFEKKYIVKNRKDRVCVWRNVWNEEMVIRKIR